MTSHLIRVDAPHFKHGPCFGIVERDGQIVEAADYAAVCIRRNRLATAREAVQYFRRRGANVQWWQVQK